MPAIAAELRTYQRTPMEARQFIVEHIAAMALRLGVSCLKAEEEFCRLAKAGELSPALQNAVLQANARSGGSRLISQGTLRRWRAAYEKGGAAALAVKAARQRDETPAWVEPFWRLYAIPSKPSVATAYEELRRQRPDLALPSVRSVQRYVDALDAITANRGRFGPREIKRFRAYKVRDVSMLKPGDVYTADGHRFDAEVQHPLTGQPFRPEIVSVLDVATRRCVGFAAGANESGELVGQALLNACQVSVPAVFYVDNGSGFVNEYIANPDHGLLAALGIEMMNSIPYNSQSRGVIERFHQTCWVRGAKFLPSYMGASMDSQAKLVVFKRGRSEIAATGRSKYVISWPDFLEWAKQRVDAYNARPHEAFPKIRDAATGELRHPTPDEVWNSRLGVDFEPILPDDTAIDNARRPYEWRVVNRGQVQILGGTYFHERLDAEGWHGRRVMVGYDLHDSEKVWVRAEDGRLICVAYLDANKVPYMPASYIEQARQKRAAAKKRNAERKIEELRIEAGDAPKQVGYRVIEQLTPDEEARIEAKLADMERQEPEAPQIEAPAAEDGDRPTFINETAYWRWIFDGNGTEEEQAELQRRMRRRSFCELHDFPYLDDREAVMRAAG